MQWGMQGAWNEFESATTWFNVLPQKNEFTNRVKSTVVALSSQSDNHHAACVCMGGGGGGGGGGANSRNKYEFCGKTDQSSSPFLVI